MNKDEFEYYVEKVKSLIVSLYNEDKIDSIKLQLLMNKHKMPCGFHRAGIVYDRLIEDGFLIRDTINLGAFVNKEYKL